MLRIRRRQVEGAVARAGIADPGATARAMYRSLGQGVVELLGLAGADPSPVVDAVVLDDALLAELAAPGPIVFLASHTGNWELGAAALARHRKLHIVAKRMSTRGVDVFLDRLRTRLGVATIAPHGAFAAARKALAAGGAVALPIDQVPDRQTHALRTRFLGAEASVDRAPATLAFRAGARMLVVAAERVADGHRVRLLGAIPRREGRTRTIDADTRDATRWLDAFVRTCPASWLWLHRRWRAPRACRSPKRTLVPDR